MKKEDNLEVLARIEFRLYAISGLLKELENRSGLDAAIDNATGKKRAYEKSVLTLLKNQVKDKKAIGMDIENDLEAIEKLTKLIENSKPQTT